MSYATTADLAYDFSYPENLNTHPFLNYPKWCISLLASFSRPIQQEDRYVSRKGLLYIKSGHGKMGIGNNVVDVRPRTLVRLHCEMPCQFWPSSDTQLDVRRIPMLR